MDAADVCQTEDAIVALLEYLVDPRLPAKYSAKDIPSQYDQESVARQVQTVVMLYNYYHRKQHPELEFLTFEGFCKLAVILRPTLLAYMRLIRRSNDIELDDPEKQLSLTEKKIMDACDICMTLDASKSCPSIEGWPISKVSVLLVDTKKEKCMLQFGSSIQGVWSVIEKDIDVSVSNSKVSMNVKHVDKKKRIIKKPLREEFSTDEAALRQLAFSTVKETTGLPSGLATHE
uniref:Uncharacterized protein MANES_04G042400 n=1 Tax=Rhizophora mucronata TaxID=61149 RepID=A0A2P2K4W8_RHIMU